METPPIKSRNNSVASNQQQRQQSKSAVPKCLIPGSSKENPNLPAIICLHGRGANATIFAIQARRITYNLSDTFRFIFVEAPYDSAAGPGVLPVFESCEPFYTWVRRKFVISGAAGGAGDLTNVTVTTKAEATELQAKALAKLIQHQIEIVTEDDKAGIAGRLNEVVAAEVKDGWDGVVGVMGFSQGARMAAGLLLKQLKRQRAGKAQQPPVASSTVPTQSPDIPSKFKFGIFLGGPSPPILYLDEPIDELSDAALIKVKSDAERDYDLFKTVPTVHAFGRSDPWIEACELNAEQCAGKYSFQMDFEGGHHLPLVEDESTDLCYFIRRAWTAAKDLQH